MGYRDDQSQGPLETVRGFLLAMLAGLAAGGALCFLATMVGKNA